MSEPITPARLRTILQSEPAQAELALFGRLRHIDAIWKLSHGEVGLICLQVDKLRLWQVRSHSFPAWVREACPWGYSTAFAAMRDVESLQDMPVEAVAKIPASNFAVVKQLSTQVRNDPRVIQAAQTQTTEELVQTVKHRFPEQHMQTKKILRFSLDADAADRVEEALKVAQMNGAKNWSEALELIAEEAMTNWRLEAEVMEALAKGEALEPHSEGDVS